MVSEREGTGRGEVTSPLLAPTAPTASMMAEMGQAPDTGQAGTTSPMPSESATTVANQPTMDDSPVAEIQTGKRASGSAGASAGVRGACEGSGPSLPQRPPDLIEEAAAAGKTLQLLAFLLGDEEYGVDILMVKEIVRLTEITSVPRAPSYIQGIISLRGAVLPIFDLRQLLSMPDCKPGKKSRILVVSLGEGLIGIIVDAVTEVVELKEADLEPPPTVMTGLEADHIKGLGRYKGRLIILLDLEKVYRARHLQVKSVQGQETSV